MHSPSSDAESVILVVEDDHASIRLIEEAFDETDHAFAYFVVRDGAEAMDFLRGRGEYDDTLPDLVLLDLDLPRKTGQQILVEIDRDDRLRDTPVIVFSNTDAPETIAECYELGASAYVVKPSGYDEMLTVTRRITDFWLATAELRPT